MEPQKSERARYSADDLLRMTPDEEDHHYELDEGELILVAPTGPLHGSIESRMDRRLGTFVESNKLGEVLCGDVGFKLGDYTVRAPDVAFLIRDRLQRTPFPKDGFYDGAPDLAVEVLSPGDSAGEVLRKAGRFIEAGTRLVWIVDPRRRTVTICRSNGPFAIVGPEGNLDGEDVLPGFSCLVSELFPEE